MKRRYEELLRRYEQMQSQYFAKRDAFEKDKAKAVSELHQLGAEGLAAELREHLSLPENAEAAGRVMQEIEETIALIRIEKERVGKNMEDLVSIKDSFESQCLQICQNIRMELDKLPKMSVIVRRASSLSNNILKGASILMTNVENCPIQLQAA